MIPTHLQHRPIIAADNYNRNDGQYANDTDAESLSIGIAQWTNNENDISAKVFRYDYENQKWSPQSEELPLHRVIDLCTLTLASFITTEQSPMPITNLGESILATENLQMIQEYYQQNSEMLLLKIRELERLINLFNENRP
jgi:hypothetical protein